KYKETMEEETIRDLLGFYFARTADFVEKTRDMSTLEAEALIDEQLEAFKEEKPKIVQEW
ncbi:MAG TPA: glycosyltransferase, partial [Fervidobacterium sp.]|nr:glycosyltransferase [Fervidobacterium sp.]